MADERDPKLSAAYRALGAEEPPRALDEAILAAARRPARSWTRRWAVPLSLAAVLVLSVTVTLRIQHEAPGIEAPETARKEAVRKETVARAPAPVEEARVESSAEAPARPAAPAAAAARVAKSVVREEPKPFADMQRERVPASGAAGAADKTEVAAAPPAPAPAAAPVASAAPPAENQAARADLARSAESGAGVAAARAPQALAKRQETAQAAPAGTAAAAGETPERELERIAALRRDGRHEEADRALAEFRKRHPDYKIPAPMLERVERR